MDLDDLIEIVKAVAPIIAAALSAWAIVVSKKTASAVNGKMTEVVEIVKTVSKLEGKEEARVEAEKHKGIGAAAILEEQAKKPIVTPAAVAEELIPKLPTEKSIKESTKE